MKNPVNYATFAEWPTFQPLNDDRLKQISFLSNHQSSVARHYFSLPESRRKRPADNRSDGDPTDGATRRVEVPRCDRHQGGVHRESARQKRSRRNKHAGTED